MPGDPLRAKHLAENFLEGARQFNAVRNMFGYTGTYKGKPVSVMGSGMGGPSMGLYSYELFAFYGVERIVRIGTCGGLTAAVDVGDLVMAMTASTDSNYAHQYKLNGSFSPCADFGLLDAAAAAARERPSPAAYECLAGAQAAAGLASDAATSAVIEAGWSDTSS